MKRTALISSLLLLFGVLAHSQDASRVWLDPLSQIGYEAAQEYASNAFGSMPSFSQVGVGWSFRDEDAAWLPQQGDGESIGFFDARSVLKPDSLSAVKGEVSYRNGMKRNVLLNASSDWDFLRPYALADTVGGDLRQEEYYFKGLWSRRFGKVVMGVEGSFRALHEWRDFDPRPRDITSDFYARLSGGIPVAGHLLSLSASYRKYHQKEDVEFLQQSGANSSVFHLVGLGGVYGRFTGTSTFSNTRHRGQGFGVSVLYSPLEGRRFSAGLGYGQINLVQHLVTQNETPITEVMVWETDGFASLVGNLGGLGYGVELKASYEARRGTENVINNVTTGTYDNLLSMDMYSEDVVDASARMVMESSGGWFFGPSLGWHSSAIKHLFPMREMEWTNLSGSLFGGRLFGGDPWLFRLSGEVSYAASLSGKFTRNLVDLTDDPDFFDEGIWALYQSMHEKFTDGAAGVALSARAQRRVSSSVSVFASASYLGQYFGSGDGSDYVKASMGICF